MNNNLKIRISAMANGHRNAFMQLRPWMISGLLLMMMLAPSCKDKVDDYQFVYEYDYYPLDSGRYVIYDVDSILYRSVGTVNGGFQQFIDTIRYQLKESYVGAYYDSFQGNLKYRIEYFRRKNQDEAWKTDRVWYALKTTTTLQRQEDDLRFIKLVFPARENFTWDGTSLIPKTGLYEFLTDWKFKYTNVGKPYTINGKTFNQSITVTHIDTDESDLINNQLSREVYAKGVGIVYREWDKIEKQDVLSNWQNPNRANGFRIRMKLNSYFPL